MAKNKVLITGGCGFVGSNLTKYLLKKSAYSVRVLDNLSSGKTEYLEKIASEFKDVQFFDLKSGNDEGLKDKTGGRSVELIEGDIRNETDVDKSVEGTIAVVHLAALTGVPVSLEKPRETFEVNVNGTQNLLEACRSQGVNKFVMASSNAAVGEKEPPIHEEMVASPISPYGASKLSGESLVSSYANSFDLEANALRFANVYGPYSDHKMSVIPKFIRKAKSGKELEIYGDGDQTRDFIHAEDIAQAILLTLKSEQRGEVFQIGSGEGTTINELAQKIKKLAKNKGNSKTDFDHKAPRKGDIYRNYSDPSKAKEILNFELQYKLDEGLKRTWKSINIGTKAEDYKN